MPEQALITTTTSPTLYIAKSNVCLNSKGESIGRGVFASGDFGAGEQLAAFQRPLVGSLDTERLLDTCANCYIWTEGSSTGTRLYVPEDTNVQKCAGCQRFRYCSKACQKEAWHRGHKHECKLLKPMAGKDMPKAVLACMELLIRRKHGLISDEDWELLCNLQPHVEDFKRNGNYGNMELMAMGASQFSLTQNMFNKDFVAAMYARVLTNSLTLITPTLDPLGIILDPILGHINHSCDPNSFVIMDGAEISIRTLKPIKRDEEIYISYIDTTNPYYRRQSELQARWFFRCKCTKCQKGATLDEDQWALEPKALSKKVQDEADAVAEHEAYAQDPANYVGETKDEIKVATIQGKAFAAYEEVQRIGDAEQALQAIESAMRFCHESGLWPVYRQPHAALRDDIILNLLSIGDYPTAWAHCAKRYKYILPKLYPIYFHPIRVVQTWQMAMLAAYLASTKDGIGAPGVNMGLIAMMLVKQVLDASSLSHGSNSAFTKSVRRKAEEMIEELKRSVGNPDKEVMDRELEAQRDMLMQMGDSIKM
ncbi:SET domain-containing protein [Cucurbitaria berberidis CBS 394.84]|uniref:SET domain-containing protein n=1 Tax=Cucurbitaria berberidis CBS 394.84 TaxID=1168544 RepID=A0A9P4GC42_9PLEO|nr:SET domain-containing protein [Cucurbitaria berberidis CBS 394.84]KAF1842697.1 SET domain-containing protein [Cucurbitaria berberidis CBS 394.84]